MRLLSASKKPTSILFVVLLSFLILFANSCNKDESIIETAEIGQEDETALEEQEDQEDQGGQEEQETGQEVEQATECSNAANFVFNEDDGLIRVEFEKGDFSDDWAMKSTGVGFSGEGFMIWEGQQYMHDPGNGTTTFKLKVSSTGTYQFLWKSAIKTGTNGTEHNDTWLRFADAKDFYAKKESSVVYPKDLGKTPNPEGATKDGWFKVYRSGNDLDFKWQARTYDNNAHDIFVVFEEPGIYLMEVSARSSGHAIDSFVLFRDSYTATQATSNSELSAISCD